ncbi:MAG: DapH/DapD/GlmU-related protein, partial [Acidimicrobiia bacterium]
REVCGRTTRATGASFAYRRDTPKITYLVLAVGQLTKRSWNDPGRLLGVRMGSRVFDDGCWMTERTLVTIGDDCTLNAGSTIQGHSLEDGTFKSDHITIGAGCTIGINAFVHYGVLMGHGAVLDADSFLMKGEEVAPQARWRGNPARDASAVVTHRPRERDHWDWERDHGTDPGHSGGTSATGDPRREDHLGACS